MGWRPKEDFEGEEEDFIDAKEFVRRKHLFDKIDGVGKELRETKKALRALQAHHEKVKEAEYQHALKQLREEKKAALEAGDADKLIEIDDQIATAKAQQIIAQQQAQQQAAQPHPGFVQWVNKNQWYKDNAELRMTADQVGSAFAAANPETAPDEVLAYVEKRIRKLYPEVFTNPNRERPSAVEGRSSNQVVDSRSKSDTEIELTDEERRVMNTFIRQGVLTKEQYIADIRKLRGL